VTETKFLGEGTCGCYKERNTFRNGKKNKRIGIPTGLKEGATGKGTPPIQGIANLKARDGTRRRTRINLVRVNLKFAMIKKGWGTSVRPVGHGVVRTFVKVISRWKCELLGKKQNSMEVRSSAIGRANVSVNMLLEGGERSADTQVMMQKRITYLLFAERISWCIRGGESPDFWEFLFENRGGGEYFCRLRQKGMYTRWGKSDLEDQKTMVKPCEGKLMNPFQAINQAIRRTQKGEPALKRGGASTLSVGKRPKDFLSERKEGTYQADDLESESGSGLAEDSETEEA